MPSLIISNEYGYVIIVASILAFQIILVGIIFVGRTRTKIFNEKFMKENFNIIHSTQFHEQIITGGYPDMGNGRYSERLTYAEWYKFNNCQRIHLNFVQSIASYLTLILLGGLFHPLIETCFGVIIIIGRLIYSIGYYKNGPRGRSIGVLMINCGLIGSLILSILSGRNIVIGNLLIQ